MPLTRQRKAILDIVQSVPLQTLIALWEKKFPMLISIEESDTKVWLICRRESKNAQFSAVLVEKGVPSPQSIITSIDEIISVQETLNVTPECQASRSQPTN